MEDYRAIIALSILLLRIAMWAFIIAGVMCAFVSMIYGVIPYIIVLFPFAILCCATLINWLES